MNNIDEDFYFEESNPKKVFLYCLGILFILGAAFGAYYYFWDETTIRTVDVTVELGEPLSHDINTYMRGTELNLYTLDVSNVKVDEEGNVSAVGDYSYTVSRNGNTLRGKIFVRDSVAPEVETQVLTAGLNENFAPDDFLTKCFDLSGYCKIEYANDSYVALNETEGTHQLTIKISDVNGNSITKDVTLIISSNASLAEVRKSDLEVSHLVPSDPNWDNTFTFRFDLGKETDSGELDAMFLAISNETLDSRYTKTISDRTTIAICNQYDYVIGLVVRVDFTDGTSTYVDYIELPERGTDEE